MTNRGLALIAGLAALVSCFDPSSSEHRTTLRLSLDATGQGGLLTNHLASVLGSARLTISSAKDTRTQTITLGSSDTSSTFDVTAPSGTVRFTAEVLSNNQTVLIRGDTSAQIDRDGFAITMRPIFVAPFLAIAPTNPAPTITDNGQIKFYRVRWALANVGTDTLRWRIDSAGTPGATSCIFDDLDCFRDRSVARLSGGVVDLFYRAPSSTVGLATRSVLFRSNVGTIATTAQGPP